MPTHTKREEKSKGTRRRLFFILLLMGVFTLSSLSPVFAMQAYVGADPENAKPGDEIQVTVHFDGDGIGHIRANLEYDSSVISYQGDEGDSGVVPLSLAGEGSSVSRTLQFKAVNGGSSSLTLTPIEAYDIDESPMQLPETQIMFVSVEGEEAPAAEEEKEEETSPAEAEEPAAPEEEQLISTKDQEEDKDKGSEKKEGKGRHITIWLLLFLIVFVAGLLLALRMRNRRRR